MKTPIFLFLETELKENGAICKWCLNPIGEIQIQEKQKLVIWDLCSLRRLWDLLVMRCLWFGRSGEISGTDIWAWESPAHGLEGCDASGCSKGPGRMHRVRPGQTAQGSRLPLEAWNGRLRCSNQSCLWETRRVEVVVKVTRSAALNVTKKTTERKSSVTQWGTF